MVGVGPEMVWVVNRADNIYKLERSNYWNQIGGSLKGISVGVKTVWGVNAADQIYFDPGRAGDDWRRVAGSLSQVLKTIYIKFFN